MLRKGRSHKTGINNIMENQLDSILLGDHQGHAESITPDEIEEHTKWQCYTLRPIIHEKHSSV